MHATYDLRHQAPRGATKTAARGRSAPGTVTSNCPNCAEAVDILATGGTLGLGEDRICVQVKSGDGAANHDGSYD